MVYEGGRQVEVETPLHKIPLFIREGSGLALGDLQALYRLSRDYAARRPDLDRLQRAESW